MNSIQLPSGGGNIAQAQKVYVDSENGTDAVTSGDLSSPFLTPEYALTQINNTGTITGSTNTNTTISGISDVDNANLEVGMYLSGTGIPFGTIIVAKGNQGGNANTVTLSKSATATASGLTLTWWKQYRLIANGTFNVTSSLNKSGVIYDFKNAIIYYGAIDLFRFTSNSVIPEYFFLGTTYGTASTSRLFNHGVTFVWLELDYGNSYSAGTGTQIGNGDATEGLQVGWFNIYGEFLDARFGRVARLYDSAGKFDGRTYGLLSGIYFYANGGPRIIRGRHQTPASIQVLRAMNCDVDVTLYGTTQFHGSQGIVRINSSTTTAISGGSILSGFINSTTITVDGSNLDTRTSSNITLSNICVLNGNFTGNITCNSNCKSILNGDFFNITNNGEVTITCNSKFDTNGQGSINLGANSKTYLYGKWYAAIQSSGSGFVFDNYAELRNHIYGAVNLNHSGLFRNFGVVNGIDTGLSKTAITLNNVDAIFENYGVLKHDGNTADSVLISKTAGILKLMPGTKIQVANAKSPIRCTANTSASRDVYYFNAISNCDGTTYGLTFAFDGSSFAPNDLAGGTLFENVNY